MCVSIFFLSLFLVLIECPRSINRDDFKLIRQSIIDMVMATEMKQHFEHLAKFDNNFNKRHMAHDDSQSAVSIST